LTRSAKSRLNDELEFEKTRRLLGDRFILRNPSSLDDYLAKERIKREVKDELLDEKRRHQREKELSNLWGTSSRVSVSKSKLPTHSKPRNKSISRAKSPAKAKARPVAKSTVKSTVKSKSKKK
jgi:hypothetical protein